MAHSNSRGSATAPNDETVRPEPVEGVVRQAHHERYFTLTGHHAFDELLADRGEFRLQPAFVDRPDAQHDFLAG